MPQEEASILRYTRDKRKPLTLRRRRARKHIPLDGREFELEIDGLNFKGRCDNYIDWCVYVTGSFFEYTYLNALKRAVGGGLALDVGTNTGNHLLAFSSMFDQVIGFEPYPLAFERARAKAESDDSLTVFNVALSNENGSLRFAAPEGDNWGRGHIQEDGEIEVQVAVGDDWIRGQTKERVNFIKIDVEGHELEVLQGLSRVLEEDRPVVMFEAPKFLRKKKGRTVTEAFGLFPDDFQFVAFKGQSTFPVQTEVARVYPVDRHRPRMPWLGKYTNHLAFGPERGLRIENGRLTR